MRITHRQCLVVIGMLMAAQAAMIMTVFAVQSMSLAGTWNLAIDISGVTADPKNTLKQGGETITGTYKGAQGEVPLKETLRGSEIRFNVTVSTQGLDFDIEYTGTVEGNSMKGKIKLGEIGEGTFTGKKEEAKKEEGKKEEGKRNRYRSIDYNFGNLGPICAHRSVEGDLAAGISSCSIRTVESVGVGGPTRL